MSCRSNHLHLAVTANRPPDEVRRQLKAWTVRRLKELASNRASAAPEQPAAVRDRWWAERGSSRYLNDEDSLDAAVLYVRESQDAPHPVEGIGGDCRPRIRGSRDRQAK